MVSPSGVFLTGAFHHQNVLSWSPETPIKENKRKTNRKAGKGRVPHQDVAHFREVNDLVHRPSVAMAVLLQSGQEIVKFLSYIPDLTILLLPIPPKK